MLEVEFVPHRQVTGLLCCLYMWIGHPLPLSKLLGMNYIQTHLTWYQSLV